MTYFTIFAQGVTNFPKLAAPGCYKSRLDSLLQQSADLLDLFWGCRGQKWTYLLDFPNITLNSCENSATCLKQIPNKDSDFSWAEKIFCQECHIDFLPMRPAPRAWRRCKPNLWLVMRVGRGSQVKVIFLLFLEKNSVLFCGGNMCFWGQNKSKQTKRNQREASDLFWSG